MITIDFKRENLSPTMPMVFSQTSCAALFEKAPEETFKRGKIIFWNNPTARHVYLVTGGIVKLSSTHQNKELLEDYFQKGEMLNYREVLDNPAVPVTATAMVASTKVKKIPLAFFQQAVRSNHKLYEEVLDNLTNALQRAQDRLLRLTLLSAQQRVYHFLAHHAVKSGRKVGYEYVIKPVLTHQEIGNIAGVGRQTVTTVLNKLRRDGIIHFNRRYLIVRELNQLLELSQVEQ